MMITKYTLYHRYPKEHEDRETFYFKAEDDINLITIEDFSSKYNIFKEYPEEEHFSSRGFNIDLEEYTLCTYEQVKFLYSKLSDEYQDLYVNYNYKIGRFNNILIDLRLMLASWDDD